MLVVLQPECSRFVCRWFEIVQEGPVLVAVPTTTAAADADVLDA